MVATGPSRQRRERGRRQQCPRAWMLKRLPGAQAQVVLPVEMLCPRGLELEQMPLLGACRPF